MAGGGGALTLDGAEGPGVRAGPRHKGLLLPRVQLSPGGHVSPRSPGLQPPGARQPKPGNRLLGARLGGEAGLALGQRKLGPVFGCAHIPSLT